MPAILVICNDGDYFLRHRVAVIDDLVARGFDVTVVTGGTPIPAAARAGWHYIHLPVERFRFHPVHDMRLVRVTRRLIGELQPVAVHLITLKPAVFGGLAALTARMRGRVLVTIPGLGRLMAPDLAGRQRRGTPVRWLVERAIRLISARPNVRFTFETAADRAHWLKRGLVSADKAHVVSGAGVDPQLYRPADRQPAERPLRVLFASRLLRAKGLDLFVDTARRLGGRSDAAFAVAGMLDAGDPDGLAPETLAAEPAIRFLGRVDDMAGLLRQTDVVCLPTRYGEGIPRILIEAAASGVACVASDLPGCSAIVRDGETGLLVAPGPDMGAALTAAVARYLDEPQLAARHGAAGRALFEAGSFDQQSVVLQFARLLGIEDAERPTTAGT